MISTHHQGLMSPLLSLAPVYDTIAPVGVKPFRTHQQVYRNVPSAEGPKLDHRGAAFRGFVVQYFRVNANCSSKSPFVGYREVRYWMAAKRESVI